MGLAWPIVRSTERNAFACFFFTTKKVCENLKTTGKTTGFNDSLLMNFFRSIRARSTAELPTLSMLILTSNSQDYRKHPH